MGEKFKNFVEKSTECKYVPLGTRCSICGKKLGFFSTGFWSINIQRYNLHLSNGVLCEACKEKAEYFISTKNKWLSKELQALDEWKKFNAQNIDFYSVDDIKMLMEQKECSDKENLLTYGNEACGLFTITNTFKIAPHHFRVGIARAKKLKNKIVVFGKSEEGIFKKKNKVILDIDGNTIETTILEAFVFDPDAFTKKDMYDNFNDTIAANLRYTRKIKEYHKGWLILDTNQKYKMNGGKVIKIG